MLPSLVPSLVPQPGTAEPGAEQRGLNHFSCRAWCRSAPGTNLVAAGLRPAFGRLSAGLRPAFGRHLEVTRGPKSMGVVIGNFSEHLYVFC